MSIKTDIVLIEAHTARIKNIREDMEADLKKAEWVLENAGFRRCDSPACDCSSWHQVGGFAARFYEIKEVVEEAGYSTNGRTLLDAVKAMAEACTTRS